MSGSRARVSIPKQHRSGWLRLVIMIMSLVLVGCGEIQPAVSPSSPGMTQDEYQTMPKELKIAILTPNVLQVYPGVSFAHTIAFTNDGAVSGDFFVRTGAEPAWADLAAIPQRITIPGQGQISFPMTITVPLSATVGMTASIQIYVDSHQVENLADKKTIMIEVIKQQD